MSWQDNVNRYIKDKKLTQKYLANSLGITEPSMTRKLKNERKWSVDDLIKISRFFEDSIDNILGLEHE